MLPLLSELTLARLLITFSPGKDHDVEVDDDDDYGDDDDGDEIDMMVVMS